MIIKRSNTYVNSNVQNNKTPSTRLYEIECKSMSGIPTTAIILYRNNESSIERCILSLVMHIDNIVLIDTGSSDSSNIKISNLERTCLTKITTFNYLWNHNFSAARNFALSKVQNGWCCFFDADEWLSDNEGDKLITILSHIAKNNNAKDCFLSPTIANAKNINSFTGGRFFLKESGLGYAGMIHEEVFTPHNRKIKNIKINVIVNHDGYMDDCINEKYKRNYEYLCREISKNPLNIKFKFYLHRRKIRASTPKNTKNIISAMFFLNSISQENDHCEYSIELIYCILIFFLYYKYYTLLDELQSNITERTLNSDILYLLVVAKIDKGDSYKEIFDMIIRNQKSAFEHPFSFLNLNNNILDKLVKFCNHHTQQ